MIVTLTNKQHPDRSVQFHWIDLEHDIYEVTHDTTLEHEFIEIMNANAHTGDNQIDGWDQDFDADTLAKMMQELWGYNPDRNTLEKMSIERIEPESKPESKTVEQEIEEIKENMRDAIIDAYLDHDRATMSRLGWILEIIELVQQQQAQKEQQNEQR